MSRKNPCTTLMSKLSKITHAIYSVFGFVKTNPRWVGQAALFTSVVAYEASHTYTDLTVKGSELEYAVARSCGAALKLVTLSTLVPLNRVFYTKIQTSEIGKYFGLDRRITDHKLFGLGMIYLSLIHAIAHYLYNPDNYLKQAGISGMLMLASLLIPIAGIFTLNNHIASCSTNSWGTIVLGTHRVGAAMFGGIYIFHTADLRMLKYVAAAACSLAVDRLVEYLYFRHPTQINKAAIIPDTDFVSIVLKRPARFKKFHPGQHAFLSFPAIDGFFELPHPFTLVRDDGKELEFIIKNAGRWTRKLYHFVNQLPNVPSPYLMKAVVIGPFGDAIINHTSHKSLTVIGTGAGLTPALSIMNGMLYNNIQHNDLHVHISQKTWAEMKPVIETLATLHWQIPHAVQSVDLYLTKAPKEEVLRFDQIREECKSLMLDIQIDNEVKAANTKDNVNNQTPVPHGNLFTFFQRQKNKGSTSLQRPQPAGEHLPVRVHLNRPDLSVIVNESKAVNVCGSQQVSQQVTSLARRFGRNCTTESF